MNYDFNKWSSGLDFQPIGPDDVKWLAENTTDAQNEISGIVKRLKNDTNFTPGQLVEMLIEIQELIEQYPRNTMHLCKSDGMFEVVALICSHSDK